MVQTKIFNGKKYKFEDSRKSKTKAQVIARSLRKDGNLARVAKGTRGWYIIWYRKK